MTRPGFLALVLLALPLSAQYSDLAVSISPAQRTAVTGQHVELTVTAFNRGPDMHFATLNGVLDVRQQRVSVTPPEGWTCPSVGQDGFYCTAEKIPADSQGTFRVRVLTANHIPGTTFEAAVRIGAGGPDDSGDDNLASSQITVVEAPSTAAVSIHATPERTAVAPGQTATIALDVRNDGPDAAANVLVQASYDPAFPAQLQGAGWTCTAHECRRPLIAAGESAPLAFSLSTTAERVFRAGFIAGAELSNDPSGTDNLAEVTIGVGDAASWRRMLLPLSFGETPGAFGSLWKTEITAVIDSPAPIEIEPKPLCIPPHACPPLPLRRPFDFAYATSFRPTLPARFVYVRAADEAKLALNVRVRDLTRTAETWGTEVPVVRENGWRTGAIILMPLPVDPLFRITLRVYDYGSVAGNRVAVHCFTGLETEPRLTVVKMFATEPGTLTTALLPGTPGYIQFDPLAEAGEALAGAQTMWLRVEPLTPGLRFWAFASVTNNPTGHVTTVTPY
jgi:hypothetical protein